MNRAMVITDGREEMQINKDGSINTKLSDGANLDGFNRLRVSNPISIFDTNMQYNTQPLFWVSDLTGEGTATHLPNESSVRLRCTTANGDKVIRQSKQYIRYQPGKSQLVELTGVMGAKKTNVRQRIGYFDVDNGVFFEQDSNDLKVVRRTYVSGSPVDNAINQSSWNIDKMDGTGVSGVTIDTSKSNIVLIDMQWLGVGRVRYGFVVNGIIYYCHEIFNANILSNVYMTTANLPVRYEIENLGITDSDTDMIQICCSVQSEGGLEEDRGITHAVSNGITSIAVTTRRPILTIRPSVTFNALTNRGLVIPLEIECFAQTNSAFFEVVYNGALTGADFSNVGANSIVDRDIAATAISGGEVVASGFVPASANSRSSAQSNFRSKLVLCNDFAGTAPDTLSLVVTSFNATCNATGSISFRELY